VTLLKDKRIFVSGGAGVIGLEMVPRLIALGATVIVGDLKTRPKNFSPKVIYRQGDLNQMTEAEFRSFAPDVFIHLAATFERSTESYEFWEENFRHNVRLSHHLMTLAKDAPSLCRVVFASIYLIYDPAIYQFNAAQEQPISLKESDPVFPRNMTGMAKFSHEIELRFIEKFCGNRLSAVCARIYRGYGRNSRDVISRWVRSLLKGEPITIYRPEGIFDFIYAADSAEGLIRLAAADHVKGIINLGTGRSRRVQDVVDVLRQHFPNMQTNIVDSDIPFEASQADTSRYKQLVGWEPVYDLPQAIAEIIDFERARLETDADVIATKLPMNVLISSSASKVPLVRAMQAAVRQIDPTGQVVAGDLNTQALTSQVADGFWAMPPTRDESLDDIISGLRQRRINVVLPTRDGELMFWSRHAARLRIEGVHVVVSEPEPLRRCLDKLEFARFGSANDLPFILTSDRLDDIPGECLVVKERFGAGSRSIGLRLDRVSAIAHARTLETPVFQPYVEGWEISVDAWLDRCNLVKGLVLRRRDRVVNGESQVTTTFSDASLEAQALAILQALQLSGPVVMQAMVNPGGDLQVIECNPRFGGASTTSIAAGLSSLHWSLLEAINSDLSVWPFHRIPGQLRQVRLPTDIYISDPSS
jgi:carbamoyl-phosphate synthase large subunit